MASDSIVVVSAPEDLSLLVKRGVSALRRHTVLLRLSGLGSHEAGKWEQRLNRETRACGCEEGALGIVVGIFLLFGYVFTHRDAFAIAPARTAIIAALFVVTSAIVGKSLGLLAARRRLTRALLELQLLLENSSAREFGATVPTGHNTRPS
jgi:hypothetical protein